MCFLINKTTRRANRVYRIAALAVLLFFSTNGYSQPVLTKTVELNLQNATYPAAFAAISEQTGAVFSYDPRLFDNTQKISIQTRTNLTQAMKKLLPATITYKASGHYIILSTQKNIAPPAPAPKNSPQEPLPVASEVIEKPARKQDAALSAKKMALRNRGDIVFACHNDINSKNDNEMKKQLTATLAAIAAATFTPTPAPARPAAEPNPTPAKAFQVTFVHPLGIYGVNTPENTYRFSLNILSGYTGGISGFELAYLSNINRYNVKGGQVAGLFNYTQGAVEGAQIAGLFNMNYYDMQGAQIAGIYNYTQGNADGLQLAGIGNYSAEKALVQIGGIGNYAKAADYQLSGIANVADSSKLQIAGVVNITKKGCFQLGVVNVRDTADGCMLGLINIAKKGGLLEVEVSSSEFFPVAASFRSGTEKLYSSIGVGYNFNDKFWTYSFGLGTTVKFSRKFGMNVELIEYTLVDNNFEMKTFNILAQARPLIYFNITNRLKIFAGPTANLYIADNTADNPLHISAPYTIASHYGSGTKLEAWIGGMAGLRFNFAR